MCDVLLETVHCLDTIDSIFILVVTTCAHIVTLHVNLHDASLHRVCMHPSLKEGADEDWREQSCNMFGVTIVRPSYINQTVKCGFLLSLKKKNLGTFEMQLKRTTTLCAYLYSFVSQ